MTEHMTLFDFDGQTFQPELDHARLRTCLERVQWLMTHPRGEWWTLAQLARSAKASESGVSARIRDLRKEKHGGYDVESERLAGGLWRYRIANTTKGVTNAL